MKIDSLLQKMIALLFLGLFFLVPLFFTPYNSELFEFNKMLLVYAFTVLIVGAWAARLLLRGKFVFTKTPLDIPLILFFLSQVLATFFSIDAHTSFWGYYSRFNGGLLSTSSYLLLYWAFVNNCQALDVVKLVKVSFVSAFFISSYGILEHFGHSFSCLMFENSFDVSCWVQDVQNRVFATLGQPNWLAVYLAILVPVSTLFFIKAKSLKARAYYLLLATSYYLCLLFTGSRSGFLGLVFALGVFWLGIFWFYRQEVKTPRQPFLIFALGFLLLSIIFGTPFPQLNRFVHYQSWQKRLTQTKASPTKENKFQGPALEVGGTESGEIRKIVWKGAWEIFKHYPLFGSGVETFAYSYYNFRPREHNLVSEWDFLYNKAHNEYLNYLSTTGIIGLGSYLFFIFFFVFLSLRQFLNQKGDFEFYLSLALFSGWLSILVSNFFGFSVVIVSLYFYLIPALIFVLSHKTEEKANSPQKPNYYLLLIVLLLVCYLLSKIINLWRADAYFATGQKLAKQNQYALAYEQFSQAISLLPNEPTFLSDFSSTLASLALLASAQKDASTAAQLGQKAIDYSEQTIATSPRNLNFLKTRVKVFYTLSTFEPKYLEEAVKTLEKAIALAPTDPKLVYNLGLLYAKDNQIEKALGTIQQAIELKPNYEEARQALALFYEELGENQKAAEQLEYLKKLKAQ